MSKKCFFCKKDIPDNEKVCPFCGAEQSNHISEEEYKRALKNKASAIILLIVSEFVVILLFDLAGLKSAVWLIFAFILGIIPPYIIGALIDYFQKRKNNANTFNCNLNELSINQIMINKKQFWDLYNVELEKQKFPFLIYPDKSYTWATVNGEKHFDELNLSISLIKTKYLLETHIILMKEKDICVYTRALMRKNTIEQGFGEKLLWRNGKKGKDTRAIEKVIVFDDLTNPNELIMQNIEIVKKFIKVFNVDKYGNIHI